MKKHITIALLIIVGCTSLAALPTSALAANPIWDGAETCLTKEGEPCDFCDAVNVTVNVITFLAQIAASVAVGVIVYGAVVIMTAGGSPERMKQGRTIITYAVVGVIITLAAWLIINTVLQLLVDTGTFSMPWQEIDCDPRAYDKPGP